MIFDSHQHVDVAFFGDEADGISGLGAVDCALLVFRAVVAAFEVAPEVNDFAFERYGVTLGLGKCEDAAYEQECEGCERREGGRAIHNGGPFSFRRAGATAPASSNHGYIAVVEGQPGKISYLKAPSGLPRRTISRQ